MRRFASTGRLARFVRLTLVAPSLLCIAGLAACDRGGASNDRSGAPTARLGDTTAAPASVAVPVDSAEQARVDRALAAIAACPRDGRWHACSVEHRLQLAGLRPARDDSAHGAEAVIPGVAAPTIVWRLGRQSVRVAFFDDSARARSAFGALDSARAAPPGDTTTVWPARPTLIRSVNLVAVFLGGTDRQVTRMTDALLAGPPQPQ